MTASAPLVPPQEMHGGWVRLRTLILLRWLAVAGQLGAIFVAWQYLDIVLPLGLCLMVVGATIIANLVAVSLFPQSRRLGESEALFTLMFDMVQLALLLGLTGGLNNPFALLILAPTTVAATALRTTSTVVLATMTIILITVVGMVHLPLVRSDGAEIGVPPLFEFGYWLAIIIGVAFLGVYARRVASEIHSMGDALLATQMALAREQKLTDLSGVVAAAAHELGTPLATIKLTSAELVDELVAQPGLRADAELIRDQADRCRDILRSMGRAGKDDTLVRAVPLAELVREAAEPHAMRGKRLNVEVGPGLGGEERQPLMLRRPEVIHGLRNLIQNAVDFSARDVWIDAEWTPTRLIIRIMDDGPGFPPHQLARIGDPFIRGRRSDDDRPRRPGYEGMGLGLFIAKTLLERTGAELSFANGADPFLTEEERPDRAGAIIEVIWPRERIVALGGALDENKPNL